MINQQQELWNILVHWPKVGQPTFELSIARNPLARVKRTPDQQAVWKEGNVSYGIYWWGEPVSENGLRGWAREVRASVLEKNRNRSN